MRVYEEVRIGDEVNNAFAFFLLLISQILVICGHSAPGLAHRDIRVRIAVSGLRYSSRSLSHEPKEMMYHVMASSVAIVSMVFDSCVTCQSAWCFPCSELM